jgi:O-antigen/teichoic acid export membrane protein
MGEAAPSREAEAAPASDESSSIFRNTLSQSAPVLSTFVFSFVLAPVMISRLGLAQFGVWAVTGALAQYVRLLDFGITGSLARFIALYDAEGNRHAIEETVGVGLLAAASVSALTFLAAALSAPVVSDVLGVLDPGEMRIVLLSAAGVSSSYLFSAVLNAVPVGLRRMGPPAAAETAGNVLNFLFSLAALLLSTKLTVYALANLAAAIAIALLALVAFLYVWSGRPARRPSLGHTRGILSFGIRSQMVNLAQLVNVQTDKIIIAGMLGPRVAGAYEIGNRVVQGALSLGLMTLAALIPTATADLVKRGGEVIAEYFSRYTVRSLSIAWPLLGALCVGAPYLLYAWLGESPPDTTSIIALLSLAFAVSLSTGVAMTLVVADGHPGLVAQTAAIVVTLNIAATLVAAPIFGLWGVLIATVAADVIASAIFLVRFHRRYGLSARVFFEAVGPPAAVTLVTALPFAVWYLLVGVGEPGRLAALLGVLATGGLYAILCWLAGSRFGLLPEKLRVGAIRRRIIARHATS